MTEEETNNDADPTQNPETDEENEEQWAKLKGMSDGLKKAIGAGIRGVLNNDDGLRKAVKDAVPTEVLGYVMRQVDSAKDEVVKIVGNQTRKFLENLDLGQEIQKVLTSVSLEFRTELRFIPNDKAVKPEARVQMKVKGGESEVESKPIPLSVSLLRDTVVSALNTVSNAFQRDDADDKSSKAETEPEEAPAESTDEEKTK
jgi:hypothetical protein